MKASNQISAAVFSAFVKCPTKAHLLAIGEPAPGVFFVDIEARISSIYKPVAKRQLHTGAKVAELLEFGQLWCSLDDETIPHYVDCDTVIYDLALPQRAHGGRQPQKSSPSADFVPVLFLPWDKPNLYDSLLVCFGALALSQAIGTLADTGTLIYGDGYRRRSVRIGDHVVRTRQAIEASVCPACLHQWTETQCLSCSRWSPHSHWSGQ
jgi:hypothetical protein